MDNIFATLWRKREAKPTPVKSEQAGATDNDTRIKGGSFEERIVRARDPHKALTVSAVYRAMELRAKTIGLMPVQYQRKDTEGGNFMPWMQGIGKRINYLLQEEPNPLMSGPVLWQQVTIQRVLWGNGFVYIERDIFGDPIHLWLAECGGYNYGTDTYNITYFTPYGPRIKDDAPSSDVLHFPNTFRYFNGFWGIPTLQYAAETLSLIKTEKAQSLETAAKGGRMKLIIGENPNKTVTPIGGGLYDKKYMEDYADELNDRIYTKDVIAMRALSSVEKISLSSADQQLLEQMNLGLDDVARFWGVPRPLLMLDTNSHYNDYSNATMEFVSRTILPDKTDMEKEISRKLLGIKFYGSRRIHICEKPLLAMDPERQAKIDEAHMKMGWTVNEIRNEHDMPKIENGDIPYVSTNLAELGSAKLRDVSAGGRPTNEEPKDNNDENDKK